MPMAINFPMLPVCWWWWCRCRCRAHKTLKTNRRGREREREREEGEITCNAPRDDEAAKFENGRTTRNPSAGLCVCVSVYMYVCMEGVAICCCLCVSVRLRQLHPSANNLIVLRKQSIDTHTHIRIEGEAGKGEGCTDVSWLENWKAHLLPLSICYYSM